MAGFRLLTLSSLPPAFQLHTSFIKIRQIMNECTGPGGHAWAVGTQDTATHNAQKIIERMNE